MCFLHTIRKRNMWRSIGRDTKPAKGSKEFDVIFYILLCHADFDLFGSVEGILLEKIRSFGSEKVTMLLEPFDDKDLIEAIQAARMLVLIHLVSSSGINGSRTFQDRAWNEYSAARQDQDATDEMAKPNQDFFVLDDVYIYLFSETTE